MIEVEMPAGFQDPFRDAVDPLAAAVSGRLAFEWDDGGRRDAGYTGDTGDCVVRSAVIASGRPYREVYDLAFQINRRSRIRPERQSPRNGMMKHGTRLLMEELGLEWTPTMQIGSGCQVHLRPGEIPMVGRLAVSVSKHVTAVVDGRIRDTYDPSREGTRCVYGYWRAP